MPAASSNDNLDKDTKLARFFGEVLAGRTALEEEEQESSGGTTTPTAIDVVDLLLDNNVGLMTEVLDCAALHCTALCCTALHYLALHGNSNETF